MWLFGSVARGDDGPDSDIDIAIRVTKPRFAAKIAAEDILRPVSSGTSTWPFCRSPSAWATLRTTTSFGWSDAEDQTNYRRPRCVAVDTLNRPRVTTPSRFTVRSRLHWVGKTSLPFTLTSRWRSMWTVNVRPTFTGSL